MIALARTPSGILPALLVLAAGGALASLGVSAEAGAAAVAVAAVLAAVAVWALVDLQRFLLVAVLGAMIVPAALVRPAGAQVAAADALLVIALGAWLVRASVQAGSRPWTTGNRLLAPSLLFAAVTGASLAWSVIPGETVKTTIQIVEIVVVIPLVFASLPRSVGAIRSGLLVFVGVTCVLALVTLAFFAPRAAAGDVTAQFLPGLHKNAIGSFLGAGLVLAYTFWLSEARPRVRRLLGLAALLELAGMFAAASRGALVGAFLGVVLVSVLLHRRRALTLGLAAVAALAFVVLIDTGLSAEERAAGGFESSAVREYSFDNALDKIAERPLLGSGAGTYRDFIPELDIGLADPNNMFLLTAAELGIAGIAAILFLLYRFGRLLVGARHLPRPAAVPAVGAGAVAVSLLVHFQVDATWIRGSASLAFASMGLLLAAGRLAPPARAAPAPAVPAAEPEPHPPDDEAPARDLPPAPQPAAACAAPLRVLHVLTSDAYAGIERHAVRLARELRELGCAAELACPPSASRLRAAAAAAGIPVHPAGGGGRGPWLAAVARRLAAKPPNVLHLHDGRAAVAGTVLARLGRPVVVRTQHFTRPASVERPGLRGEVSLALHRTLNRRLDGYVAVSQSVAGAARGRRETSRAEVAVIPPGIEPPSEEAVARAVAARERSPRPVVAFVGRLEAEKRLDTLLRAIPHVLERLPACRFVIAGSGGQEAALRRLAERLGVQAAVDWTGEVAEPAAVLERAHLYVNPSPAEGFGLATIEAMAFALPAVGIASGGSAEVIDDGVTGVLVPPGDAGALATAIVGLAGDRRRAAQVGAEARRRIASRYGIDRTARATLDLYRRLGGARRS